MEKPSPSLSVPLGALDLDGVDAPVLTALIAREATLAFGTRQAVVWRHHDEDEAFLLDQSGREVQIVQAPDDERWLALGSPALRETGAQTPLIKRLAAHSFNGWHPGYVLSLPLISTSRTVGLLLVGFDNEPVPDSILPLAVPFSAQAGGLLRNHDILQRTRAHASALGTLLDASRELFLTLDPVALCQTVVRYARVLTAAPVAYLLMTGRGSAELSLMASDGLVSETFSALHPDDLNLLGAPVARESQALSCVDYLTDCRFPHSKELGVAIAAERLRSLVATPIHSGYGSIGMLYVADRTVRKFSPAEVEAVAHLCRDSALALGNAHLYEEVGATLRALAAGGEVLRAENEQLRQLASEASAPPATPTGPAVKPSPELQQHPTPDADDKVGAPPAEPTVLPPARHEAHEPTTVSNEVTAAAISPPGMDRDLFAELLAESLADKTLGRNGSEALQGGYRLLVVAAKERRAVAPRSLGPAPAPVRAQLATALQAESWCRGAADREGNVVALVAADLADPTSVIGSVLDAHQDSNITLRAALGPPCQALEQYHSSYATCRRTLSFLANTGGPRVVEIWKTGAYLPHRLGPSSLG